MNRVAVVGSINLDIVLRVHRIPRPGETVGGGSLARHPGGKGANQAVAAARAGADVSLVGAVGRDESGALLLTSLREAGVDVSHVTQIDGVATGTALIAVDAAGANAIALVEGANHRVEEATARAAVRDLAPDVLLLQREIPYAVNAAASAAAPDRTVRILNAAPLDPGDELPPGRIDWLVMNELEASALVGREVTPENALAVARELVSAERHRSVITLGSHGLVAVLRAQEVRLPALAVPVVDTTGAGDAFCGALAAAVATGDRGVGALVWGNAAGALATTRPGAQPSMPAAAEIEHLLETLVV